MPRSARGCEVRMQGALWPAEIVHDSPYDPENARIRADG